MSKIINGIAKDLKSIPEKLKAKTGNIDKKKLVLMNLPYVLSGYFCDKIACLWRVSPGQDASAKMMAVMAGMEGLFSNPLPSFYPKDLLIGAGCGIALRLVVYFKAKNAKKFRHGMEYGSARWGNAKDIEPYMDAEFENNILLTQTERLIVGRRIEGDTNSKLFFQLFSRRLRSAFCKCIMLSKMLHTAGIDFSFETQKAIDPVVRSTATRCI